MPLGTLKPLRRFLLPASQPSIPKTGWSARITYAANKRKRDPTQGFR